MSDVRVADARKAVREMRMAFPPLYFCSSVSGD